MMTNPDVLSRLRHACDVGADLVIGSRYVRGRDIRDWRFVRVLLSFLASLYLRAVLGFPVRDASAGFKCNRRRVLEEFDPSRILFLGCAFQVDMKYAGYRHGFRSVEIPIAFVDRVEGVSKMSLRIFKEAVVGVVRLRSRTWCGPST